MIYPNIAKQRKCVIRDPEVEILLFYFNKSLYSLQIVVLSKRERRYFSFLLKRGKERDLRNKRTPQATDLFYCCNLCNTNKCVKRSFVTFIKILKTSEDSKGFRTEKTSVRERVRKEGATGLGITFPDLKHFPFSLSSCSLQSFLVAGCGTYKS